MCNDYEQHIAWDEYCRVMTAIEIGLPADQSAKDLPRADDIRIGQTGPVLRAAGHGAELAQMTFGFPAPKPGRAPVFNFRSDGRHFRDSRRCVILASAFFEFTGAKYPKTKHRFTLNGEACLGIAGLWRAGEGNHPSSFTMLTTGPGADIAPYHDRQVCVLRPRDWMAWIDLSRPEAELLRPLPAGSLDIETVRQGRAA